MTGEFVAIGLKDLQKIKALAGCELLVHDDREFQALMDLNPETAIAYHKTLASLYKRLTQECMSLESFCLDEIDEYYYSRC